MAKLKEAQMTELEKANARAEKAEAELAAKNAEAERLQAARELASKNSVPVELLEFCANVDDMEAFCKAYHSTQQPIHAAASGTPFIPKGGAKQDPRSAFVAFAKERLS